MEDTFHRCCCSNEASSSYLLSQCSRKRGALNVTMFVWYDRRRTRRTNTTTIQGLRSANNRRRRRRVSSGNHSQSGHFPFPGAPNPQSNRHPAEHTNIFPSLSFVHGTSWKYCSRSASSFGGNVRARRTVCGCMEWIDEEQCDDDTKNISNPE